MNRAITTLQSAILVAIMIIALVVGVGAYYLTSKPSGEVKGIVIGDLCYSTGAKAWAGDMSLRGMIFAIREINAGGGIKSLGGRPIEMYVYDMGETSTTATSALRRMLVEHPDISLITGDTWSGDALVLAPILEREKIPIFTGPTTDKITELGYKYFFRCTVKTTPFTQWGVGAFLEMAKAYNYSVKNVGILYDDNPSAGESAIAIRAMAAERGLNVAFDEMIISPLKDATPVVMKLKEANVDFVECYIMGLQDLFLVTGKMKELGVHTVFLMHGGIAINPDFPKVLGDSGEGVLVIAEFGALKGFEEKEKEMLEFNPDYTFIPKETWRNYQMGLIVKEVLEAAASTDPTKIMEKAYEIDVTTGEGAKYSWGRIKFDAAGNLVSARGYIFQWQKVIRDGKTILEPICVYPEADRVSPVIWKP